MTSTTTEAPIAAMTDLPELSVLARMQTPEEIKLLPGIAIDDLGSEQAFIDAIDLTIKYFDDGDIVEGTVVKVDRDEVLLDIGYKTEGVIPSRELSIKHDVDPHEVVELGDKVEALVLTKEDKEGRLILSKKRAQYERAWGDIEKRKDADGIVKGTVIEVVKGGLILDIGLRGFLPASLVEMRRVRDLVPYVGRELEAKIIELDKNRNNVVLSRRAFLEETQSATRHTFLTTLQKGQVRHGTVSSIVNFGAFVDLGGVDGLVHVSELSWKHIDHPGEVVEVGQEVTVEVLDVDMDRERVSLSLKATQEDPWQLFARTHEIGQVVPGKVTKIVPFGAFVRVDDGIEGLVHISELAERHVETADQVVGVGDDIFVKVIDIDLDRRRISLSLKQANDNFTGGSVTEEFDPYLYGMPPSFDEAGAYIGPEGFDPETNEWRDGFDAQREEWERQYNEAYARWTAHREQVEQARTTASEESPSSYSSETYTSDTEETPAPPTALATDEALQALRAKLTGGS
jgi:small subunit ribosomal protein S1